VKQANMLVLFFV